HRRHRRLDLGRLQRQVAGDLIADQAPDLLKKLPEALDGGILFPHQAQLVLHQRMVDDRDALHAPHPQKTVPSEMTAMGGPASARFSLAIRRPAAHEPPSNTRASGNASAVTPSRSRTISARRSSKATVSARVLTIS